MTEPLLEALDLTAQEMRDAYRMNPADSGALPPVSPKPYKWITLPGNLVRPECRSHQVLMKWALKLSKDYPDRINKYTLKYHAHPVIMRGLLLQVYKCPEEGCEVEAVK